MRRLRMGGRQIRYFGNPGMRNQQDHGQKVRQVYLFNSVERALQSSLETLASHASIKCPGYEPPSAGSTVTDKISAQERMMQAVWVMGVAKDALTPVQLAWVMAMFNHVGQEHRDALNTLTGSFPQLHRNAALLHAVLSREFKFGETYCESLPTISAAVGMSLSTVEKVASRVRVSMADLGTTTVHKLRAAFNERGWLPRGASVRRVA